MDINPERKMLALKIIELIGDCPFFLSFQKDGSDMHLVSNMTSDSIMDMLQSNLEYLAKETESDMSEQVH